jgi:ferredoxin-NADP reductase
LEPNRPAPLLWQTATIAAITSRTARVRSFFLTPSAALSFRAGQHVDVRLTAPDGYQARRSYSIASAPEQTDTIELTIERLDDGEVSPFFHDVAAVGDKIELRGPIGGHFVWSAADGGTLTLLGGGSGVVPLMSMLRHRAAQASRVPTVLLLSARSWDELIFRDELLELESQRDGLALAFTSTREPARRAGDFARRVDTAMIAELMTRHQHASGHVFVCGANGFVETAADALIASGVAAAEIRTERYGV